MYAIGYEAAPAMSFKRELLWIKTGWDDRTGGCVRSHGRTVNKVVTKENRHPKVEPMH